MYLEFFGFREKPFSKTPDPRFLFLSRGHREALARLEYAVEERELVLLTGDIGCGKTTLSRALMDSMGEAYHFCFIFNPKLGPVEFLRTIAASLGIPAPQRAKDDLLHELTGALYQANQQGVCPVVVVDEAQLIPHREVFEEIRLLNNFQLDDRNLLSIIIMGQPELRRRLAQPVFEPLRQRFGMQYHLLPLDLEETLDYLDFRLQVAGGVPGLFLPDAVQRIFELSGGVPRKINQVASSALLLAFGKDQVVVDGSLIEELAAEIVL